jgi:hypothetical protein
MASPDTPAVISYRHLLTGAVGEFLQAESMPGPEIAQAVAELVANLSRYREERVPLSPIVFITDDRSQLLTRVGGREIVSIGTGLQDPATVRKALKLCAPLANAEWSVFIERAAEAFHYGLFRTDAFVLSLTPFEMLGSAVNSSTHMVAVAQLAESVLELRGSQGNSRYVYLSGARTEMPAPLVLETLVNAVTQDVSLPLREDVRTIFRHAFLGMLRMSHGALVAVLSPTGPSATDFVDGLLLETPIDLVRLISRYRAQPSEDARWAVQAVAHLLQGMLATDGITVLRSNGQIAGYNAFVHHLPTPTLENSKHPIGGARQRTFAALSDRVGATLVGAFYYSQDGHADCRWVGEPTTGHK